MTKKARREKRLKGVWARFDQFNYIRWERSMMRRLYNASPEAAKNKKKTQAGNN